jgi:enoyl-CoA hydratase/carnithine racemase
MTDVLQIHRDGRLLRIALNRPEKRNALNLHLCRQLVHTLESADRDPSIGAILLTGNGKCFCAGMDLGEVATNDTDEISSVHEQLFTIGSRLGKPLVAGVQNASLAGGTGLAANCHIVIAREDALFGLTEIRLGLWPFVVFRSVVAAVSERRAVELALTGRVFGAAEAREMGLVHEVTAHLEGRTLEVATALATSSPTAIRSGLRFVEETRGLDSERAGGAARRIRDEVFRSEDFREGLQAFLEKRAARWPSLSPLDKGET